MAKAEEFIVCFDADQTLFMGHLYRWTKDQGKPPSYFLEHPEEATNHVKDFLKVDESAHIRFDEGAPTSGFKNKQATVAAIRQALSNGHKVSVASYTLYPGLLKPALKEMGLSEEELALIPCVGGFPTKEGKREIDNPPRYPANRWGKELHIKQVKQELAEIYEKDFSKTRVILLDDTANNCEITESKGNIGIVVPKNSANPDYLTLLTKIISKPAPDVAQQPLQEQPLPDAQAQPQPGGNVEELLLEVENPVQAAANQTPFVEPDLEQQAKEQFIDLINDANWNSMESAKSIFTNSTPPGIEEIRCSLENSAATFETVKLKISEPNKTSSPPNQITQELYDIIKHNESFSDAMAAIASSTYIKNKFIIPEPPKPKEPKA